jgi:hypothetical protein
VRWRAWSGTLPPAPDLKSDQRGARQVLSLDLQGRRRRMWEEIGPTNSGVRRLLRWTPDEAGT